MKHPKTPKKSQKLLNNRLQMQKSVLVMVGVLAGAVGTFLVYHSLASYPPPALNSPAEGATTSNSPTLQWSTVSGASQYKIQIARYDGNLVTQLERSYIFANSSQLYANRLVRANQLATITSNGTYYWRVRVKNSNFDFGAWSQIRKFTAGTTPPPPPPSACSGPTITLTGTTSQPYTNSSPAANTNFNLTNWYSNAVGVTANHAFEVGETSGPKGLCIQGGVVNGHIDQSWDWTRTHSYGGSGFRSISQAIDAITGSRVHNVEDGWKPRECPSNNDACKSLPNLGTMKMRDVYMTGIRDDAIENDEFMPGDIADSLFDGIWCFLSEQNQSSLTGTTIGAGEDPNIRVTRSLVRLYTTNGSETGPGHWFKWQGRGMPNHHLVITDSIFAVDKQPRLGWSSLSIPSGTTWQGTNYILWLGTGTYGGPKPAGVTYQEGQTAKNTWNQARNNWLIDHGYDPRPVDDFNPMDDPVVAPRI